MRDNDTFLSTWLETLAAGHTLTAEDLPRLARAAQAIRNGAKHHAQARAAETLTAAEHIRALKWMGATRVFDAQSVWASDDSVTYEMPTDAIVLRIPLELRDEQ